MDKKYACSLLIAYLEEDNESFWELVNTIRKDSEKLVVAMPNDNLIEKITTVRPNESFSEHHRAELLKKCVAVDDFKFFDEHSYRIEDIIQFWPEIDCIFWGEETDLAKGDSHKEKEALKFRKEELDILNEKGISAIFINEKETSLLSSLRFDVWAEDNYLKDARWLLKDMLFEFDRVCRENNIKYYVIYGTLLGVIRDHDLIEWDDDVDIAMSRSDYNRFRTIVLKEWGRVRNKKDKDNEQKYALQEPSDLGKGVFYDFMSRVVSYQGEVPTRLYDKVKNRCEADVFNRMVLDIYILDNYSNKESKHKLYTSMMKGVYTLAMGHRDYVDYSEYYSLSKGKLALLKVVNWVGKIIPFSLLNHMYESFRVYASKELVEDYFLSNRPIANLQRRIQGTWFQHPIDYKLDGHPIMVPNGYNEFLAVSYRNYMSPPDYKWRKPFHYLHATGTLQ